MESIVGLILLFELTTIFARTMLGSAKKICREWNVEHIHHSYVGIAVLLLGGTLINQEIAGVVGSALIISDMLHHFIVLNSVEKNPEFP